MDPGWPVALEAWQWGLVIVLGLGLAVIAYGVVTDRNLRRDRLRALREPAGAVPGADPDAAPPRYVTGADDAEPAGRLGATELAELRAAMGADETRRVDAGHASADFVTEPETGWAVVRQPQVLVCADEVTDVRDLQRVLAGASAVPRALVVVAGSYDAEVLATLAMNARHGTLAVLAVIADESVRASICAATGASPVDQATLRRDILHPDQLGAAAAWVSDDRASWIVRHDTFDGQSRAGVSIEE